MIHFFYSLKVNNLQNQNILITRYTNSAKLTLPDLMVGQRYLTNIAYFYESALAEHDLQLTMVKNVFLLKWRILSQPAKIGSGKSKKSLFFLLGLKITLRTCFQSNNFSSNSCPELSNQVLSFSEGQIYQQVTKMGRLFQFKFLTSGSQVWT